MSDNVKPFFLTFLKKEKLTSDCYAFYFRRTPEARPFVAGQYYEIKLPHKKMDDRGDSRVFTISSSPTDKDFITITTRIIQSSFKLCMADIKKGEKVHFDGPWDDLNFDEKEKSPYVFLAGGIGVTPYHSIVKYSLEKKLKNKMTLFVSWKKSSDMVFHDFFMDAEKRLTNFKYIPTLTDEILPNWKFETGRIDPAMIKKYKKDFVNNKYFIAGPPAMVSSLKKLIQSMEIPKENIVSEDFEGYMNDRF